MESQLAAEASPASKDTAVCHIQGAYARVAVPAEPAWPCKFLPH